MTEDQKIIKAKFGTGNEAEIAKRIVKKECEKEGLNYDDVMKGTTKKKKDNSFNGFDYSYGFYNPNDGYYHWGNPHQQSAEQEDKRKAREQQMWEEMKRASDEIEERLKRQRQERENFYKRRTITDFPDKHGTVWSIAELMSLTRSRRLDLFDGEDPLSA